MNRPLSPRELRLPDSLNFGAGEQFGLFDQITALIITHDEAHNIRRPLAMVDSVRHSQACPFSTNFSCLRRCADVGRCGRCGV